MWDWIGQNKLVHVLYELWSRKPGNSHFCFFCFLGVMPLTDLPWSISSGLHDKLVKQGLLLAAAVTGGHIHVAVPSLWSKDLQQCWAWAAGMQPWTWQCFWLWAQTWRIPSACSGHVYENKMSLMLLLKMNSLCFCSHNACIKICLFVRFQKESPT